MKGNISIFRLLGVLLILVVSGCGSGGSGTFEGEITYNGNVEEAVINQDNALTFIRYSLFPILSPGLSRASLRLDNRTKETAFLNQSRIFEKPYELINRVSAVIKIKNSGSGNVQSRTEINETDRCENSGSITFDGDADFLANGDITYLTVSVVFDNCELDAINYSGSLDYLIQDNSERFEIELINITTDVIDVDLSGQMEFFENINPKPAPDEKYNLTLRDNIRNVLVKYKDYHCCPVNFHSSTNCRSLGSLLRTGSPLSKAIRSLFSNKLS